MVGIIPTVQGPGRGVFQGGDIVLVCRNETGVTLTPGQVGMADVARTQTGVVTAEGGASGTSVLNTMVIPALATLVVPMGLHQDTSTADGVDGRFILRGSGLAEWDAGDVATLAHLAGFPGMIEDAAVALKYTEGDISNAGTLPATINFGKVVAIAKEAAGADDIAESWLDGWHGFGTGFFE